MLTEIKNALQGEQGRTDGGTAISQSGTEQTDPIGGQSNPADTEQSQPAVEVEAEDSEIEMDQVFGVLKNKRRRYVLKFLSSAEGEITLSDLAEQIAAWECDKEVSQISSQERKRVYVGLYQCHLPKMADVSAITYNKQRGKIEHGEHFDLFEHYLPREQTPETGSEKSGVSKYISGLLG